MDGQLIFVFALVAVAAAMMASNKIRFDVVALIVVIALMLSGVLTVSEALAGFGSSVVMLVAALLVVGEMLDRTGVARAVGDLILKKGGKGETRLLILLMVSACVLGGVMSSTAVVAIFIPIVMRISAETGLNRSRLLLPMSYAALISGMLTLIATTPNLVVHDELRRTGFEGFSFFSFTLVGVAILAAAILYILFVGRKMLPVSQLDDEEQTRRRPFMKLSEDFRAGHYPMSYAISSEAPFAGKPLSESGIGSEMDLRVVGIRRQEARGKVSIHPAKPEIILRPGDRLIIFGNEEHHERFLNLNGVETSLLSPGQRKQLSWELGAAVVLIHPESTIYGKTLRDIEFEDRYGPQVLGIRRNREPLSNFEDARLKTGDTLLLSGSWTDINALKKRTHDFVVVEESSEVDDVVPAYRKMPVALLLLVAMVVASILDFAPLTAIVLATALAAVFTRCLTMEDSYRAIHWNSIVLVAGMLPLADALQKTGGTDLIVDNLMEAVGNAGPGVMLTILFFLTAGIGLFLSNTASAVLVAPIAIVAAGELGVSPYPFCVAVVMAASAAFATPVSTPVVTLVVEPGRYKFSDFVKIGVPLQVVTWLVTLFVAPLVFPY